MNGSPGRTTAPSTGLRCAWGEGCTVVIAEHWDPGRLHGGGSGLRKGRHCALPHRQVGASRLVCGHTSGSGLEIHALRFGVISFNVFDEFMS